ncbi:MAG: substrate-binding domain-containing protein, partial [Ruminiclostridium sp.]|nr:substrate-binding domain-containing protein [Ruminiclostridium sp.]
MKGTLFKTTAASLALITTLFAATSCANASATNATEATSAAPTAGKNYSIINVSYDPTRELYAAYNEAFKKHWESEHDSTVDITQSHGGSGKQALEVANGNPADVVTLALEYDVNSVRDAGLIEPGWV